LGGIEVTRLKALCKELNRVAWPNRD